LPVTSAICTLFEGDYHYGVGALCNSLYQRGYRGVVYAGYRGQLPPWAAGAVEGKGYSELTIESQFLVRFVPLNTEVHFTSYKPDFMLSVWRDHCPDADALFYFDPDIIVICRWAFFEEWVEGGVALCADVNADMPASHPFRRAWLRYFGQYGIQLIREQNAYFNGGFVGVAKQNAGFLNTWQRLLKLLEPEIGGLRNSRVLDRSYPFNIPDQDALNVATMTCKEPLSCVGRQGMDFEGGGGYIMSHAVDVKPWRKKMLLTTLTNAQRPIRADKAFLRHASSPIRLYSPIRLGLKRMDLLAGLAIGRYIG
jgi:hypothetical protein